MPGCAEQLAHLRPLVRGDSCDRQRRPALQHLRQLQERVLLLLHQPRALSLAESVHCALQGADGLDEVFLLLVELPILLGAEGRCLIERLGQACRLAVQRLDFRLAGRGEGLVLLDCRRELLALLLPIRDRLCLLLVVGLAPADQLVIQLLVLLRLRSSCAAMSFRRFTTLVTGCSFHSLSVSRFAASDVSCDAMAPAASTRTRTAPRSAISTAGMGWGCSARHSGWQGLKR